MTRPGFWELYSGKRQVLGQALINHDPYDEFAWVQEWRFSIANFLWHEHGYHVPDYRPGAGGPDYTFEYEMLKETGPHLTEDLLYALKIMSRYREWLRLAGKDY